MAAFVAFAVFALASYAAAANTYNGNAELAALQQAHIVPDVLLSFTPKLAVSVTYGKNTITNGQVLAVNSTEKNPTIRIGTRKSGRYTVAMIDPDAGEGDAKLPYLHWIMVNVPGGYDVSQTTPSSRNDVGGVFVWILEGIFGMKISRKGTRVVPYEGPEPPKGTGLHRYVFVIYKQYRRLRFGTVQNVKRSGFNVNDFAKANRLGLPVAATYFRTQAAA